MPEWIHNRAEHLLAKNPDMKKSTAFAVATQQGHALGKNPKGYGTAKGKRVAKAKFDTPKDDVKTPNPGKLESPKMASVYACMAEELEKIALSTAPTGLISRVMAGTKASPERLANFSGRMWDKGLSGKLTGSAAEKPITGLAAQQLHAGHEASKAYFRKVPSLEESYGTAPAQSEGRRAA
jgi:hypothetical protein